MDTDPVVIVSNEIHTDTKEEEEKILKNSKVEELSDLTEESD